MGIKVFHSQKLGYLNIFIGLVIVLIITAVLSQQVSAHDTIFSTSATKRYVAPNGNDNGTCTSSSSPCQTIQYAVNQSNSGDTILVAAGTYSYEQRTDTCQFLLTRAVVCFVDKGLTIKGGYSKGNWSISDPVNNLTTIEGQGMYRGIAVIAYNSTASLAMEGFTIQNGKAQGVTSSDGWAASGRGGGIWSQGGRITLSQMVFKNNYTIGANSNGIGGDASGGAIMIESVRDYALSIINDTIFQSNQAQAGYGSPRGGVALGGALFVYQSPIYGENLLFQSNFVKAGDSSGYGEANQLRSDALGGAISLQSNSEGTFFNIQAFENKAIGGNAIGVGGGAFGGAIHVEDSSLSVTDIYLQKNIVQGGKGQIGGFAMGGGLMTDDSELNLDRSKIVGNQAVSGETLGNSTPTGGGGGGLYLTAFTQPDSFTLNLSNLIVADNIIDIDSPEIEVGGSGAGLVVQGLTANIYHATISNNQVNDEARFGQAIMITGLGNGDGTFAIVNLNNSIVSDHINPFTTCTSAITVVPNSTLNINGVLFANNTNDINDNSKPVPPGTINGISTVVKAETVGFVSPGNPNYDYHLLPSSPAIDKVEKNYVRWDYEGEDRPFMNLADLGADEYTPLIMVTIPEAFYIMTDGIEEKKEIKISTNKPTEITWNAQTSEPWIKFVNSPLNNQYIGRIGESLKIIVDPNGLQPGQYIGSITITSSQGEKANVQIYLYFVKNIYRVFLPLSQK